MKQDVPTMPTGSLIERAASVYDFGDLLKPLAPPAIAPLTQPQMAPPPVVAAPAAPAPMQAQFVPQAPLQPLPSMAPALQPAPQFRPTPQPAAAPPAAPHVQQRPPVQLDMRALVPDGFIEPSAIPTVVSEEFRMAKRQVLLSAFGGRNTPAVERGRTVLICSSHPNEGKTFCSINLALSISSERDVEVVLIDADVAKPEILSTLGIQGGPGLMDAIADPRLDVEGLIMRTTVPNLSILPTGRRTHDDTELLGSARAHDVMDALLARNPRRIIIIDTAPALAASPASALARHVGQIVMVVRADRTGETEIREALGLLDGCACIHLLLNGATYAGANQKLGYYYGYGG